MSVSVPSSPGWHRVERRQRSRARKVLQQVSSGSVLLESAKAQKACEILSSHHATAGNFTVEHMHKSRWSS
eukprot:1022684-Karenia_brevis.AAC.1